MQNILSKLELKIHYWNRRKFFNKLFRKNDPYNSEHSDFEQHKLSSIINEIKNGNYKTALEIGCGEGLLTEKLSKYCDKIIGVDISPSAIKKAKNKLENKNKIVFICKNIVDFKPETPIDLIVAVDVCYYLAQEHNWQHMEDELTRWAKWLNNGGKIILAHCFNEISHSKDWLGRHIMEGYRKILGAHGLTLIKETVIRGEKDGDPRTYLLSVLQRE